MPHADWPGDEVTTAYRRFSHPIARRCIEAALHELVEAAAALEHAADGEPRRGAIAPMRERLHRGYANLRDALTDAERAAAAARPLAGRVLTATGTGEAKRARR